VVFADPSVFTAFGLARADVSPGAMSPAGLAGTYGEHRPKGPIVSVIVIEFITLDGIVTDPDGSGGTPAGGWAFRHGPATVAGDKFQLGNVLDEGVLLLGRTTWELFSRLWPGRDDPFSTRMNTVPKLVATRTPIDTSAWGNSAVVEGDLIETVRRERRDVVVTGSLSVVRALMAEDLVDEYRLLTFPTVLGAGECLFPAGGPPVHLECRSAERSGAAVLTRYGRSQGASTSSPSSAR
jgi:dihydrofolate reductase